ncbi:Hypothetical predicted protein [Pelobates cultripes]|uniref:Uncharacterized protein n=1 Tax=Pelobates cultripes TaxID=61616 RepID=A0AAD1WDC9_PELCU|nr:Hypothetical predicted protein [Pelobates cultripes]
MTPHSQSPYIHTNLVTVQQEGGQEALILTFRALNLWEVPSTSGAAESWKTKVKMGARLIVELRLCTGRAGGGRNNSFSAEPGILLHIGRFLRDAHTVFWAFGLERTEQVTFCNKNPKTKEP